MSPITFAVVIIDTIATISLVVICTRLLAEPARNVFGWAGPFKNVGVEAVVFLVEGVVAVVRS